MRSAALDDLRTALWHLRRGGPEQLRTWRRRQRAERGFAPPPAAAGVEGGWTGRGSRRRLSFLPALPPARLPRRPELTAAVVLDDFSAQAFGYEWTTVALDPVAWRAQCEQDRPDFLFVESAWAGNSGLWRGKVAGEHGADSPLAGLTAYCRENGIPSVFWNKEDPPHYDDFLPAARLFDQVFTSDGNRLPAYRKDLGHERIGVLPFAAQPAVHNPVRPSRGRHARDVAFAGMYFAHKYGQRREQMELLLGGAMDASPRMRTGLEIFSRQLGGDPNYQFPAPLDARVVGSLTYPQMLSAYKAYKVFLNVNSVVDSPSMCARRIFEITASGTPVVSASSEAIANFFTPEEVPVAEDRRQAEQLVRALVASPELNDRTVHLAQRKIWQQHTYAHRAEAVVAAAAPLHSRPPARPSVSVLVPTIRPHRIEGVFRTVAAQRNARVQLVLLTHGFELPAERVSALKAAYGLSDVVVLAAPETVPLGECLNRCVAASDGDVLARMDDDDHYGPNYLGDQLNALEYSQADVVGKQAHYVYLESRNASLIKFADREHRFTDLVMGPTITARRPVLAEVPFPALGIGEDTAFLRQATAAGLSLYSADRFNYYQHRVSTGHTWALPETEVLASGRVAFYGRPDEHVDI